MKEMVETGLVEPINPMTVLDSPREISRPFIDYINRDKFKLQQRRSSFQNRKLGPSYKHEFSEKGSRIHADKFDKEIFYQLTQMQLAKKEGAEFLVEKKTAGELMTFLASVLGAKLNYLPTTDQNRKRFRPLESKKDFQSYKMIYKKRELILNELIPFPENIDMDKLRNFKNRHSNLLTAFKNRVEIIVLNPEIEEDSALFKEAVRELKLRKEELTAKMNENSFGNIFFGTVCGVVSAVIGIATTESLKGAALGVPEFAHAFYSALQIEKAEDIFDQSGLKYLALLDKRLTKL